MVSLVKIVRRESAPLDRRCSLHGSLLDAPSTVYEVEIRLRVPGMSIVLYYCEAHLLSLIHQIAEGISDALRASKVAHQAYEEMKSEVAEHGDAARDTETGSA